MKKSRWVNYRKFWRPIRYLELIDGMVALMKAEDENCWRILTTWNSGKIEKSAPFQSCSAGELAFSDLCDQLSAWEKDVLIEELSEGDLKPAYRGAVAVELARLHLANDALNDEISRKAEQFVATHTPEECETYIAEAIEAYKKDISEPDAATN